MIKFKHNGETRRAIINALEALTFESQGSARCEVCGYRVWLTEDTISVAKCGPGCEVGPLRASLSETVDD